jgi:hypothetical protein
MKYVLDCSIGIAPYGCLPAPAPASPLCSFLKPPRVLSSSHFYTHTSILSLQHSLDHTHTQTYGSRRHLYTYTMTQINSAHFVRDIATSELSNIMDTPDSFRLYYFSLQGLGQTSRDILEYAGAKWEMVHPDAVSSNPMPKSHLSGSSPAYSLRPLTNGLICLTLDLYGLDVLIGLGYTKGRDTLWMYARSPRYQG